MDSKKANDKAVAVICDSRQGIRFAEYIENAGINAECYFFNSLELEKTFSKNEIFSYMNATIRDLNSDDKVGLIVISPNLGMGCFVNSEKRISFIEAPNLELEVKFFKLNMETVLKRLRS